MKRVVYSLPDGAVVVASPSPKFLAGFRSEEEGVAALLETVPADALDSALTDIPSDRTFRDAWRLVNGQVKVDMERACNIAAERLERARRAKARELMERELMGEDVSAEKAALQSASVSETVAAAKTPEELKARCDAVIAALSKGNT